MAGEPDVSEQLRHVLSAGERLLWSGSPKQGIQLRASDGLMIPFSLMWGGFAIFWEVQVLRSGAPVFFALWGVPFVLIGLYMIFGRFILDARSRARTFYGLTNERVVIISGLVSRTTTSLSLRNLSDVSLVEHSDGSGTIHLGRPSPYATWMSGMRWPGMSRYEGPMLELLSDANAVHSQILEAQRRAT